MRKQYTLACCLVAFFSLPSGAQGQPPPARVVVEEARSVTAPSTIRLVGTVRPARRSRVASETSGKVLEMPAREGDRLALGETLTRLDDKSLQLELAGAEALLAARQAQHEELLEGTRPEELRRLKALLDEARAEYERWQQEMARVEKLYGQASSNEKEMYDTRAELLVAQNQMLAAEAAYNLGVEGPRREEIARAAHAVAEQQAMVDRLKHDLTKNTIAAPFDGFVSARLAEVGEWVAVGEEIVELIELATVLVRVDVPEFALPYVEVGQSAPVEVEAIGERFDGRVRHIVRQADEAARTFPVDIEVSNDGGPLAAGMFARATVIGGPEREAIAVPKDAVVTRGGVSSVAVLMPGQQGGMMAMPTNVTVGVDVGDWVTITSGNVQAGAQVVVRGNENLPPFPTPVIIVDEKGNPVAGANAGGPPGAPADGPSDKPGEAARGS